MQSKHIGIVACSFEGAALCYRTIGIEAERTFGEWSHPRITLDSISMAEYLPAFDAQDYAGVGALMMQSIRLLAAAGAEFAICPDNSCHLALPWLQESPIPFLSILDVVADEAQHRGYRRVAILGTRYTMEATMYPEALSARGIAAAIPTEAQRSRVNSIIFDELVKGVISDAARADLYRIIGEMKDAGCDSVALVCTELPLIVGEDSPLPTVDSTRLLAKAATRLSVS